MKKMLMVMLMLAAGKAWAQPDSLWSRTYGGENSDQCFSLIQTADGSFAMTGWTESFGVGSADFWLVRTNVDGDSLWSRTFGGGNVDWCPSLNQTVDGGFALAGVTQSFGAGDFDFWLVRTNTQGDALWSRTFGGGLSEYCYSHIQTTDGGFALAGSTELFGGDERDFWLVRTSAQGDSLWSHMFSGGEYALCNSVIQTADGGFVLTGNTYNEVGGYDFWLVRTNADGDSLWSRTFDGGNYDWCTSLIQTTDGGFVLTGVINNDVSGDDFWLVRTNADGDSLWSRTYGGGGRDECSSLIQTADGGFALAGSTDSFGAGERDFWLVRTNADGDSLWSSVFGGVDDEQCYSLVQTVDGGFALAGYAESIGAGGRDFWLVKTSPDPASVSDPTFQPSIFNFQLYPNPFNSTACFSFALPKAGRVKVLALDPSGRVVVQLAEGYYPAGAHSFAWQPGALPTGAYFVRGEFGGKSKTMKAMLVK